jgi:hypothetical protein
MGQLLDMRNKIDAHVAKKKLEQFKVRGQLTLACGFMVGFVNASTPDDPKQIAALKKASKTVLNLDL